MSSVLPIKYPLDLTGNAPTNRVASEPHDVGVANKRVFMPNYGPFYARTAVVRNRANGAVLTKDVQWRAIQMIPSSTRRASKLVCGVVMIIDPTITQVEIDYQVFGGDQSASIEAIEKAIADLSLDNRPVYWGQIIGKPAGFNPTSHLHDAGDIYGFEYEVAALYSIRDAILEGDVASHQELIDLIRNMVGDVDAKIEALRLLFQAHAQDKENPHEVNKTQIGLPLVENYAIASQSEAQAGALNTRYMTPLRVAQAIQTLVGAKVDAHIARTDNPHGVTKDQIGLNLVQNFGLATTGEAQAGVLNTKYMTPALVKAAIDAQAITAINTHAARTDNPHQVNKGHVGLPLVENFGIATLAEAQGGTATNKYMTPALVKAAITANVGDFASHISRTDNPHQTNASQVGLGNVPNVGYASEAEANAGSGDKFMTPWLVAQAIQNRAINPLTNLINQRVLTNSNGQLASLRIGQQGYFYQDGDGSITLQVVASRYFQFQAGGNFVCHNGRVIAGGGFQPSDKRLKRNIKALDARPLWRGAKFSEWDMRETGDHQLGVVAQDWAAIAPDRTYEYDHELASGRKVKRLSVDYVGSAFEMAIAAGQELDALQSVVDAQQKVISSLERRLAAVEAKR